MRTVIDIGTNTILMLVAEFNAKTLQVTSILDELRIPRLGAGVDSNRRIPPESLEKAISVLKEYKSISYECGSTLITATATSFIRDAANKNEFISEIQANTGIDIEVLSGNEEARWSFWGAFWDKFRGQSSNDKIGVIDIGGGSTEIISAKIPREISINPLFSLPINALSIDIGSVRIKERYLDQQPPPADRISEACDYVQQQFEKLNIDHKEIRLVGVAGTITTLAAIKLGLSRFEKGMIENLVMSLENVNDIFDRLKGMSCAEIGLLGNYMGGREDIILSGTLILKMFMERFEINEITVSTKGLRHGIFLREEMCQ